MEMSGDSGLATSWDMRRMEASIRGESEEGERSCRPHSSKTSACKLSVRVCIKRWHTHARREEQRGEGKSNEIAYLHDCFCACWI